jgi:hypothetical protein
MTGSPKAVVLEQGEIICGLGTLEETVTDLFENECAIVPGPCFGVDVRFAPFKDVSWRSLPAAARRRAAALDSCRALLPQPVAPTAPILSERQQAAVERRCPVCKTGKMYTRRWLSAAELLGHINHLEPTHQLDSS